MLNNDQRLQPHSAINLMGRVCLALTTVTLILMYFFFPTNASAHSTGIIHSVNTTASILDGPILQVSAGFNARFRDGNWIPVQINLSNSGSDFDGMISITTPAPFNGGNVPGTTSVYQEPISLANGTQKQVTIDIPINQGGQGATQDIHVNLLDSSGKVVRTQVTRISPLSATDVFVGILSDLNTGFSPLYSIPLPNQGGSMIVEPLNASSLPDKTSILKNFDVLILDNFTTSNLKADQFTALQSWVNQGGALIESGGPEWRRTLSALPTGLLPITVSGTSKLPAGTQILPVVDATQTAPARINTAIPISIGTLAQGTSTIILATGTTPLIVQAHHGQGIICYLAFDPALDPIATWSGASTLWRELVVRTLGDKLFGSNYFSPSGGLSSPSSVGSLLQGFLANNLPSPWLLLALLLGYLVILGPVRFLIIRWRKRRDWSWRIVLASIVLFSLLAYGLAVQQKGTTILSNTVSIIRLNQGNSSAHISTFVGVFVPNQGNYQVHIPTTNLVQPTDDQYSSNSSGQNATIQTGQNGTDVTLQGVKIWTLRSLIAERDRQIHGGIDSELIFQNYRITGTVTNTLSYALSDVYILMSNSYLRIGSLAAGQTMQVDLSMSNANANTGMTLADQIAQSNQLPVPYGSYTSSGNPPQNELQRHLAILSALSNGGSGYATYISCGLGTCSYPARSYAISSQQGKFFYSGGPGSVLPPGSDPLLVAGASATLIGWAAQSADTAQGVTINGATPSGLQETLVQAPLNLKLSGNLNLPPSFIAGQVVDVQGTNVQNQSGGTYTITTGSVTFEFTLPSNSTLHLSSLGISESPNLQQTYGGPPPPQTGSGSVVDASHFQVSLYNWQTGAWDPFQMTNFSFSTAKVAAYVGPSGRVLVQFANQDSSLGTIYFDKPSLHLQGTAS